MQFCRRNCHKPRIAPHKCGPQDKFPGFVACGRLDFHPEEKKQQQQRAKEEKKQAQMEERKAKEAAKSAARQRNKLAAPPGVKGLQDFLLAPTPFRSFSLHFLRLTTIHRMPGWDEFKAEHMPKLKANNPAM